MRAAVEIAREAEIVEETAVAVAGVLVAVVGEAVGEAGVAAVVDVTEAAVEAGTNPILRNSE